MLAGASGLTVIGGVSDRLTKRKCGASWLMSHLGAVLGHIDKLSCQPGGPTPVGTQLRESRLERPMAPVYEARG